MQRRTDEGAPSPASRRAPILSDRQAQVLAAVVHGYVGEAQPVGSENVAAVLPVSLSPASVRTTLGELASLGLVEKPHRSAGRIPTEAGFRAFVDQLLALSVLPDVERRDLAGSVGQVAAADVAEVASRLLSEHTRQLGFVEPPRLDRVLLRHVSFVRLSSERVLVVLVSRAGRAYQRVVEEPGRGDQARLDAMAAALGERVDGFTLRELRDRMLREAASLRSAAERLLERALVRDAGALAGPGSADAELVIATRLALLDQPEFRNPDRLRALWRAVEDAERLADILDQILDGGRLRVTFGGETDSPELEGCALVAAPYGRMGAPLGVLGVIGPDRMDYARVIPLVDYLSQVVTQRLSA